MKPQERENLIYSRGYKNSIEKEEEIMFSLLPRLKNGKLLDVGCGEGSISIELEKRGFEVYGIDFSSIAVKKAKEKDINAIECDVDEKGIPFEDNLFDVVWAGDIIEHVFDPIFLLKEIYRVSKKKGKILMTIPNDINLVVRLLVFLKGRSPQSGTYRSFGQCKHHTIFSFELLEYMLSKAELAWKYIGFIIRYPKIKSFKFSKNYMLGKLFGRTIIVEAYKKQ